MVFNHRWNTNALIKNRGMMDYSFYAHWHLDNILKKAGDRARSVLSPHWQPAISDVDVRELGITDLSAIGCNASAGGSE